jgi:HEAT repeat protein
MRFSNRWTIGTLTGVFFIALILLLALYVPGLYWKEHFYSLLRNQNPNPPRKARHSPVEPRISAEVQLHLKHVFDSLNGSSFSENNDENLDQQDFDKAINELETADDEEDRAYAVTVIGQSHKKEAIPAIIKALADPSPMVRQEAIERILGWTDDKQQEIMMIAALKSKDPDVIYMALESIYETKNKALLHQIKKLRKSKDQDIAELASEVYENLTGL